MSGEAKAPWGADPLGDALATLADLRESTNRLQERLAETVLSTTSRNRMVIVTTDGSGRLQKITFAGDAYRSLPPAELGSLLVDTITTALDAARDELETSMTDVLGVHSAGASVGAAGEPFSDLDGLLGIAGSAVSDDDAAALRHGLGG
jgi:DNA-binding protein YbaB